MELWGVDFTCAPSKHKPITIARGRRREDGAVVLIALDELTSLDAFAMALAANGPWLGAFDFPFGLPRVFVDEQRLGATTDAVIAEVRRRCETRAAFRAAIDAWTNPRPAGQRLMHRATDRTRFGVASTSPLQSRYVPVAFMYYEGLHRLVTADTTLPGLRVGRADAIALEGYPRLLAHELIGRTSYKNGDDAGRRAARGAIVQRLERGDHRLRVPLVLDAPSRRRALVDDAGGDRLDSVLCLAQAAWCATQPGYGLPRDVDAVEGWIATS